MDPFNDRRNFRHRRGGGGSEADIGSRLSPERLSALRAWVRSGGPSDPAVLDVVARRMLADGEP